MTEALIEKKEGGRFERRREAYYNEGNAELVTTILRAIRGYIQTLPMAIQSNLIPRDHGTNYSIPSHRTKGRGVGTEQRGWRGGRAVE